MRRVVVSAPCSRNFHSIAPSLPFLPCLPISGARPALAFISFSASGRPSPAPWLRPFPGLASISCLAGLSCIYTSTAFLCLAPCGRQRQPGHHLNQSAPPVSHFHQGNEAGDRCKARTNARALPHRKHLPALCYSSQMGKRGSNPSKRCPACDASVGNASKKCSCGHIFLSSASRNGKCRREEKEGADEDSPAQHAGSFREGGSLRAELWRDEHGEVMCRLTGDGVLQALSSEPAQRLAGSGNVGAGPSGDDPSRDDPYALTRECLLVALRNIFQDALDRQEREMERGAAGGAGPIEMAGDGIAAPWLVLEPQAGAGVAGGAGRPGDDGIGRYRTQGTAGSVEVPPGGEPVIGGSRVGAGPPSAHQELANGILIALGQTARRGTG